jgi:hypothetical protein
LKRKKKSTKNTLLEYSCLSLRQSDASISFYYYFFATEVEIHHHRIQWLTTVIHIYIYVFTFHRGVYFIFPFTRIYFQLFFVPRSGKLLIHPPSPFQLADRDHLDVKRCRFSQSTNGYTEWRWHLFCVHAVCTRAECSSITGRLAA